MTRKHSKPQSPAHGEMYTDLLGLLVGLNDTLYVNHLVKCLILLSAPNIEAIHIIILWLFLFSISLT